MTKEKILGYIKENIEELEDFHNFIDKNYNLKFKELKFELREKLKVILRTRKRINEWKDIFLNSRTGKKAIKEGGVP